MTSSEKTMAQARSIDMPRTAMVLAAALGLGARLRLAVPLALVAPIAVHLVFSRLLRVPLPMGLLSPPW